MVEAGIVTALGIIFVMMRFDIRKVAGYATAVDIVVTLGLVTIFHGTYAGMMTGIFAGTILSCFLTVVRRTMGYKKVKLVRYKGSLVPEFEWQTFGPTSPNKRKQGDGACGVASG